MNPREVICRVRALYPYESSDPSSLSFKTDAVISVLAQLDSGWWDGWCNGKRGWFPSNYVEIIPDEEPDKDFQWRYQQQQQRVPNYRQRVTDHDMQKQLRLSLHASDMLIPPNQPGPAAHAGSSAWIVQTTEDGSEQYYYNTQTQEMRYSIPPDFYNEETLNSALRPSQSNHSLSESYFNQNHHISSSASIINDSDHYEKPPARPVRAANRTITESFYNQGEYRKPQHLDHSQYPSRAPSTIPPPIMSTKENLDVGFENGEKLPPNWVRKVTPKGRFYYCNVITEERTWNLEDIDFETGELFALSSDQNPISPKEDFNQVEYNMVNEDVQKPQIFGEGALTWQSLSSLIAQAILTLKDSLRQGKSAQYGENTSMVVHRIRLLLYTSDCLDKETSTHLKASKQLRTLHRGLLAAVAKLVLSTKVASNVWPTPESLTKLHSDADECLIAVRNFMSHAQELQIDLKDTKPILSVDSTIWRSHLILKSSSITLMLGKSDTVTAIILLGDNVRSAMHSYLESVRDALLPFENNDLDGTLKKLKENAPMLVAQFRNLSNTVSNFLNAIEEICQTQPNDPRSTALIKSKKPIYTAMGTLFIVSQTITSTKMDKDQLVAASQRLDGCTEIIESGIQEVTEIAHKPMDDPMFDSVLRDTPTPTQRLVNNANGRLYNSSEKLNNTSAPTTPGAQSTVFSSDMTNMDDLANSEDLARQLDYGLNTLMNSNNTSGEVLHDDAGSYHSELTATRQQKNRFYGEDMKHRDTLLASPTFTSTTVNHLNNPAIIASNTSMDQPWYLASDIDPNEISYNAEHNLKGGTLHGLVIYLTQHDQLDSKFNTTFLLTYRSFCTTQELFNELFNRYQLLAPEGLKPDEHDLWQEKKLKLVRLRVFNVIKSWLETYFNEEEDRPILSEINHFTDTVIADTMKFGAEQLSKLIKKRMSAEDSSQIRKMKLNVRASDMPVPILPKNMKRIKLLELDPHELARQMTIMDFRLYNRIKPVECLDKNWGKAETDDQGHHIAANVKASIEHSNQVTAWVTDSILSKDEIKKRAAVLKHWILVAERCRLLNNFNTCMAILSAFDNGSIGRLKRTWELISARTMLILQNIRRLMGANRNFSEYRDLIHKVNPPCIPFLGIYLQDLTFIEDGNSNFLKKSNNHINFAKRMKTAEVILDLQQYQSAHYMLTTVPDIQEFIKTHLHSSREEEELYNLSLKLEPRERGEDTIARRLKESGL